MKLQRVHMFLPTFIEQMFAFTVTDRNGVVNVSKSPGDLSSTAVFVTSCLGCVPL